MSESLRNDGRIWVPKMKGDKRPATQIPEEERDYYLERRYPAFGNLVLETLHPEQLKKDVTRAMVLEIRVWLFI